MREEGKLAVDFAPERLNAAFVVCYRNAATTVFHPFFGCLGDDFRGDGVDVDGIFLSQFADGRFYSAGFVFSAHPACFSVFADFYDAVFCSVFGNVGFRLDPMCGVVVLGYGRKIYLMDIGKIVGGRCE